MKADAASVSLERGGSIARKAWVELGQVGGCLVGQSVPAVEPTSLDYMQRHALKVIFSREVEVSKNVNESV